MNKLLLSLIFIGLISCIKKNGSTKALVQDNRKDTVQWLSDTAVIRMGIPVEVDGCGKMAQIKDNFYKIPPIEDKFYQEGLMVKLSYMLADTFYCGRGRAPIRNIKIFKIEKLAQP